MQPVDACLNEPDGEGAAGRHGQAADPGIVLGRTRPPGEAAPNRDPERRQQHAANDPQLTQRPTFSCTERFAGLAPNLERLGGVPPKVLLGFKESWSPRSSCT